jgi:hypothetical protein
VILYLFLGVVVAIFCRALTTDVYDEAHVLLVIVFWPLAMLMVLSIPIIFLIQKINKILKNPLSIILRAGDIIAKRKMTL